jgi:membrane protease YdiL (CAAX protease family)
LSDREDQPSPDVGEQRGSDESARPPEVADPDDLTNVAPEPGAAAGSVAGPPGIATFSLEGRAAPGLYLVGWLATGLGLALLIVAVLSGGQLASTALLIAGVLLLGVGLVAAAGSQAIERGRHAPAVPGAYRGPSPFLVFLATLPPTVILGAIAVIPLVVLGVSQLEQSPLALFVSLVVTALVYVATLRLLVVGPGALSWRDMGLARPDADRLRDLAIGAALAIPIVILTSVLADVLVALLGASPPSIVPLNTGLVGLALNLLSAAVITPFGEELFFRGFSTTAWVRGMGERGGLIRGAVFFAVIHVLLIGGPTFSEAFRAAIVGFVGRLPVSLALGWIFLRRRSLYASIGLHATFNATLVIVSEIAAGSVGF